MGKIIIPGQKNDRETEDFDGNPNAGESGELLHLVSREGKRVLTEHPDGTIEFAPGMGKVNKALNDEGKIDTLVLDEEEAADGSRKGIIKEVPDENPK